MVSAHVPACSGDARDNGLERDEVLAPTVAVNARYLELPHRLRILGLNASVRVLSPSVPKSDSFLVNALVRTFSLCLVTLF